MGILSKNPIGKFEVEQDWNCWEWGWNDHKNDLIAVESMFMNALAEEWEFWSKELIFLAAISYKTERFTPKHIARANDSMRRLVDIIHGITGQPGKILVYTNPSGGDWVVPQYEIQFGDYKYPDKQQSFIFRTNIIPGTDKRPRHPIAIDEINYDRKDYVFHREIRWLKNGYKL